MKITSIVEAKVVNIVMYIPVAVATYGSTPKMVMAGQNIVPGPTPLKAAANDPNQPTHKTVLKFLSFSSSSP